MKGISIAGTVMMSISEYGVKLERQKIDDIIREAMQPEKLSYEEFPARVLIQIEPIETGMAVVASEGCGGETVEDVFEGIDRVELSRAINQAIRQLEGWAQGKRKPADSSQQA